MGALRTKMIEEMKLRNFSSRTEQSYVSAMVGLVKHYRQSPHQLTQEQIRSYLLHLKERGLSPSSRNVAISGLKFFYHQVLGWNEQKLFIPPRKRTWRLPEVLSQKERAFVEAARALGASDARIILRHLVPNAMGPVFVSATLGVGGAILTESVLSYLGLGVQPPTPSWGNILNEGRIALGVAWWLTASPGVCIFVTVLAFNLLGEGIRERFNRS